MTSHQDGLLPVVAALAPATLLHRLADAASSGERAHVGVHLRGGQVLDGWLVRIGADHGQDVIVLASADGTRLGYALLASVVAVEVHDPGRVQDILTEGKLPLPVTGEPVTRLALQREFAPSEEFPVQVDWTALPGSASVMANLERLLRGLRETAREVCADEMGRQAWTRMGTVQVAHGDGERLSVQRVSGGLSVRADLTAALPRDLAGEMGRQVNALL